MSSYCKNPHSAKLGAIFASGSQGYYNSSRDDQNSGGKITPPSSLNGTNNYLRGSYASPTSNTAPQSNFSTMNGTLNLLVSKD